MTHDELCKRAGRWLASKFKCGVVATEFTTAAPESPDAIGFRYGGTWSVLVECKVSRSDFHRDKKKSHRIHWEHGMGQERWYLTPPGLLKSEEIPDRWGLAEVRGKTVRVVKKAAGPNGCANGRLDDRISRNDLLVLYSIARRAIHGLGIDTMIGNVKVYEEPEST